MPQNELIITDKRTGSTYTIPIHHNAIRASDLAGIQAPDIETSPGGLIPKSLRIVDEALEHIAPHISQITFLDADIGKLYYRGYEVANILGEKTFEETCYCLIWGRFPSLSEAACFRRELFLQGRKPPKFVIDTIQNIPRTAPAITMLQAGVSAMLAAQGSTIPAFVGKELYWKDVPAVDSAIVRTLASVQAILTTIYCHRQGRPLTEPDPDPDCSFTYNLLLAFGIVEESTQKPNSKYVSWIERWLLIYADHEMSTATFVFLITASAHADPLSCYLSAISTAYGMINGGAQDAAYRMLARVGSPENVPNLLAAVKRREEMLYGFGHRIYNTRDPRARMFLDILREVEEETGKKDPLLAVAEEVDRLASQDPFFQRRGIHINPDLYACFACTAM
ncbi:MAG: hypothetical protein Q9175_004098 [Cornicularia normoerica]